MSRKSSLTLGIALVLFISLFSVAQTSQQGQQEMMEAYMKLAR